MFGRKTVDGVLHALVKTVKKLREVEEESLDLADYLTTQAIELQVEATEATHEAARAQRVRANLEKLLGFDNE